MLQPPNNHAMTLRRYSGFTLVELLIVLAIIGIIAALALPALSDYSSRAKASELLLQGSACKGKVTDIHSSTGSFPTSAAAAGCPTTTPVTEYVGAIEVLAAGSGIVRVSTTPGKFPVDGYLEFIPTISGATLTWKCQTGSLPSAYVPSECK